MSAGQARGRGAGRAELWRLRGRGGSDELFARRADFIGLLRNVADLCGQRWGEM